MDGDGGRESIYFQCWQQLPNAANGLSHRWGLHPPNCPCYIPSQHSSIKVYLLTFASAYRQNRLKSKLVMHYWTLKKKNLFLKFSLFFPNQKMPESKEVMWTYNPSCVQQEGVRKGKEASFPPGDPGKPTLMISRCYKESTDCMYHSTIEGGKHTLYAQYKQVTHAVTTAWVRLCYNVCLLQIKGH